MRAGTTEAGGHIARIRALSPRGVAALLTLLLHTFILCALMLGLADADPRTSDKAGEPQTAALKVFAMPIRPRAIEQPTPAMPAPVHAAQAQAQAINPSAPAAIRPQRNAATTDRRDMQAAPALSAPASIVPLAPPPLRLPAPAQMPAPHQAEASQTEDDAGWLAYQEQLWRRILAHRPAGMHLAGEARLRFTISAEGRVLSVDMERPSGNAMLDRLALRTVRTAAPFPPPPAAIKGRPLIFSIRFSFN